MVFAGVYPVEADQYEDLRASLEKLQLNDASLTFEPESSLALGFGFRCGFLGLLHMEIIQERLYREFDMDVITTVPNVSYRITTTQGDVVEVHNPSGLPEVTKIDKIEEPYILAQIITKSEFLGNVIKLCIDKRGVMKNQTFITQDRVEVNFDMPLSEIVFDFYDKLKSISKGYASFDYHRTGFQPSKLVKLDILLNGEPVDALSSLTYTDHAYDFGRKMCEKLKELIPRQQKEVEPEGMRLEERFIQHPALAIEQSRLTINAMAEEAKRNFVEAVALLHGYSNEQFKLVEDLENSVDRYEDKLGTYLVKVTEREMTVKQNAEVSKFLHTISDFERISDHALNIAEAAKELHEKNLSFSEAAAHELEVMEAALTEILSTAIRSFVNNDLQLAAQIGRAHV